MREKILMVSCDGMGKGGVQAVIMNTVRNLNQKYNFDIVLFTKDKRFYEAEFESLGGKIFRIPKPSETGFPFKRYDYFFRGPYYYFKLLKILKNNGPYTAIHCHNNFEAGICLKAAKKAKIPVRISHQHTICSNSGRLKKIYDKIYLKKIKKYSTHRLGCSEETCRSWFGNANAIVVNNSYDDNCFDSSKYSFKVFKEPILTQIASFSENKNQLFSLSVVNEIKKKYPTVKLNLIGFDGGTGYLSKIENSIMALGLESNIIIHPSDADSPKILNESNAFIFPSQKEGFGIVLIEAQAMGVRCYTSDSVPKSTNCGGVEYLSLNLSPSIWADKIISDFEKYSHIRNSYVCEEFALKNVIEKYKKIYRGK